MNIALIGFGNIGKGVEEVIFKRNKDIKENFNREIKIKKILVKNLNKKRQTFDKDIDFTDDFNDILYDEEIQLIIEVTATLDEAYNYIKSSLENKKHVITANKKVVSKYMEEFNSLAKKNNLAFLYEASVGGGVHIIKSIMEDSFLNDIDTVQGILNGTCNFILSEMEEKNLTYKSALKKAQELGFAEPDPTSDVEGYDSMRKIRILSTLIFNGKVEEKDIALFGIQNINPIDISIFSKRKYRVKLIAVARKINDKYYTICMPTLVKSDSLFFNVKNSENLISYVGSNIGSVSFFGQGAGKLPTSDAIMRDVMDVVLRTYIPIKSAKREKVKLSNENYTSNYYLRVDKDNEKQIKSFDYMVDEMIYEGENIIIFTKKIKLKEILNIIDMINGKYFLAKIFK